MIKAVIFDMDGTLLDSERLSVESWKLMCEQTGVRLTPDTVESFIGRTREGVIDIIAGQIGDHGRAEELYGLHREIENDLADKGLELKPGAREVLDALRDAGTHVGLATSSRLPTVQRNFDRFGLMDRFETVTCGDEVAHGKPDPEPYLMGLQKAGVQAHEAVVVENAPIGVQAGYAAGIFTIAVNTGPLEAQVLLDAGADLLFPSMQSLDEAWEEFGKTCREVCLYP